ncbi:hypothetical protein LA080_000068 [Diaporthe eres]|nr:hypothetical protein LA080_000068 [Diaporthe eres]
MHRPHPEAACRRAVIFDDKAAAGFVADEDTGRFLKLDQDDGPRRLPVEYQVKDTYPDLSRLSLSANVEDAMARVGFDGTGNTELTLTMDYVWRAMVCSFGLSMLIVNLNMKRNDVVDSNHWVRFMIESAPDDGLEKYAALGYCWGKPDEAKMQLKTKNTTIHVMLEGIPEPEITRVLKEAVQATRALGIPFLWVDALCIIQGDKGDWERESKMMGKIYNEASCTLCAISSNSCLEGFLQLRPALLSIPFRSKLDPSIAGEYSLRFRGIQEYALSKRLIVFSHNAVHFICPNGSQTLGHTADQQDDGVDYFQVDHFEADMTPDEAYNEWCKVAADFSRRLLTYPGDRSPAISGLARYFGDILGDEYLAGLWAALLEQLSRPNVYRAPSWSRVSRDRMASFGEACYDRGVFPYGSSNNVEDFRSECKSIEGRAACDGPERYLTGEVEGGALVVTTRTIPLPGPIEISDDLVDTWIGASRSPLVNCAVDWLATHDPSEQWKHMSLVLLGSVQVLGKWSASDRAAYGLVVYPVPETVDTYFRCFHFFIGSLVHSYGGLNTSATKASMTFDCLHHGWFAGSLSLSFGSPYS